MAEIRIGVVSAVDEGNFAARVRFEDDNIVSGWLKVAKREPKIDVECSVCGAEGKSYEDGGTMEIKVKSWFPEVGDKVVCAYGDGFNATGFVIGGV